MINRPSCKCFQAYYSGKKWYEIKLHTEQQDIECDAWKVATDVLPLLVNACSQTCIDGLPRPPKNYVQEAHTGGLLIQQPPIDNFYR